MRPAGVLSRRRRPPQPPPQPAARDPSRRITMRLSVTKRTRVRQGGMLGEARLRAPRCHTTLNPSPSVSWAVPVTSSSTLSGAGGGVEGQSLSGSTTALERVRYGDYDGNSAGM
jgi:hypothetical protein